LNNNRLYNRLIIDIFNKKKNPKSFEKMLKKINILFFLFLKII